MTHKTATYPSYENYLISNKEALFNLLNPPTVSSPSEIVKLELRRKFRVVRFKIAAYQAFLRGLINTNLLNSAKEMITARTPAPKMISERSNASLRSSNESCVSYMSMLFKIFRNVVR